MGRSLQFGAVLLVMGVAFANAQDRDPLSVEAVAQGPWVQLLPDDGVRIGALLVPPVDQAELAALHVTVAGFTQPATVACHLARRAAERQSALVAAWWTIQGRERRAGQVMIGDHPMGRIPAKLGRDAPARVVVIGPRNYPDREQLQDLGKLLGGPVDMVLGLGRGIERRLGLGGWETDIPLAILAPAPAGDSPAAAILGPEVATWGSGFDVGALGLVLGRDANALALAVGHSDAAWQVPVLPEAPWDPGLLAPLEQGDIKRIHPWIGVAAPLRLPLILAGGSSSGLLSEPLRLNPKGHLIIDPGGTRYLLATPAGDGVRSLVSQVALGLDAPGILGLLVTAEAMDAIFLSQGQDQPLRLHWQRPVGSRDEVDESGSGWGRGSGAILAKAFREARAADPPTDGPLDSLLLLPRSVLALGEWDTLEALALARPEGRAVTAGELRLAERLVADPWFLGDQAGLIRRLPPALQRTAILRWLGSEEKEMQIWSTLAARCPDDHLLRAIIAAVEADPEARMLDILVQRLVAQSQGAMTVDPDPLLQSRLTGVVFTSPLLSPTPLRALARDLQGKLSELGMQPVRRFLERQGRFRPVVDRK